MRMLVDVQFPLEPFNTLVRNGTAGQIIKKILADLKPEAAYFAARDGKRGGTLVLDVANPSKLPAVAEPFFLQFNASVAFHPCMTPEDLGNADLEALGSKYR
ncbi:MAG: panthothenate synthetase [Betaproteobacteria bacterium]|nr:panthothenate synthetase [Betaproteobacteria bacterium]